MKVGIFGRIVLGLGLCVLTFPPVATADEPASDVAAVVSGNNEFALDLYRQLIGEANQNVILSPFSISSALAMTYAGARGATEAGMTDALHITLPQEQFHSAFGSLTEQLDPGGPSDGHELRVVNRLWGMQDYVFLPEFLQTTGENYGADMGYVDYIGNAEGARQTINNWVQEQTRDKIKDLLPSGSVDDSTRLVLTNAIYFRGDWQQPFSTELTRDDIFINETGQQSLVPFMSQQAVFPYAELVDYSGLPDCHALRMPYADGNLSMLLLLPSGDLGDFEQALTSDTLEACIDSLAPHYLDVVIPKFTVNCEFNLNDPLQSLGMAEAFDPCTADFSGITHEDALYIQNVVHKAAIGVIEAGTEAAAATGVGMGMTSIPPQFRADHPFLYFILDDQTGNILFMGRVADPTLSIESLAMPGDANADGAINDKDATILAAHWGQQVDEWTNGDFNGDGWVNDIDATILASRWYVGEVQEDDPVPEPSAIAACLSMLIGIVALAMWRRGGGVRNLCS